MANEVRIINKAPLSQGNKSVTLRAENADDATVFATIQINFNVAGQAASLLAITPEMRRYIDTTGEFSSYDFSTLFDGQEGTDGSKYPKSFYAEPRFVGDPGGMAFNVWFGAEYHVDRIEYYHNRGDGEVVFQMSDSLADTEFRNVLTVDSLGQDNLASQHNIGQSGKYLRMRYDIRNMNFELPDYIKVFGYYIGTPDFAKPPIQNNYQLGSVSDFMGHCTFLGHAYITLTVDDVTPNKRIYQDGKNWSSSDFPPNNTFGLTDSNARALLDVMHNDGSHVMMNLKEGMYHMNSQWKEYDDPAAEQTFTSATGTITWSHGRTEARNRYGIKAFDGDGIPLLPASEIQRDPGVTTFEVRPEDEGKDITLKLAKDFAGSSIPYDNDKLDGFHESNFKDMAEAYYHYSAIYGNGGGDVNESNKLTKLRLSRPQDPVNQGKINCIQINNEVTKNWYGRRGYAYPEEYVCMMKACYDAIKRADPNMSVAMGPLHGHFPEYLEEMHIIAMEKYGFIPWDEIAKNQYANDAGGVQHGSSTQGVAPEAYDEFTQVQDYGDIRNRWLPNGKLHVDEFGYDANDNSKQKAVAIGSMSRDTVLAAWVLRSYLRFMNMGCVDRAYMYMIRDDAAPNAGGLYNNSGLVTDQNNGMIRKPAWYVLHAFVHRLGAFTAQGLTITGPDSDIYIEEFAKPDGEKAYVVWHSTSEDKVTNNFQLPIATGITNAKQITFAMGSDLGNESALTINSNQTAITVREMPVIVMEGVAVTTQPTNNNPMIKVIGGQNQVAQNAVHVPPTLEAYASDGADITANIVTSGDDVFTAGLDTSVAEAKTGFANVSDRGGLIAATLTYTVNVTPVGSNQTPTNIQLTPQSVLENEPSGTLVGTLSTVDADGGDTHTYTLTGTDAASFSVGGDELRTAATFDRETKSSYDITITSDDGNGGTFSKDFTISIIDQAAPAAPGNPLASSPSSGTIAMSWDSEPAADLYRIEYKATSSATWTSGGTRTGTSWSTSTGISGGTSYDIRVRSENGEGNSAYVSDSVTTGTSGYTAPTGMTSTDRSFTDGSDTRYWTEYKPVGGSNTGVAVLSLHGLGWRGTGSATGANNGATMARYLRLDKPSTGSSAHAIDVEGVIVPQAIGNGETSGENEAAAADGAFKAMQQWATVNGKTLANTKLIVDGMSYGGGTLLQFIHKHGDAFADIFAISMAGTRGGITAANMTTAKWSGHEYWIMGTDGDTTVSPSTQKGVAQDLIAAGHSVNYYMGRLSGHSSFNDKIYLTKGETAAQQTGSYDETNDGTLKNPPAVTAYNPDVNHILNIAMNSLGYPDSGLVKLAAPNQAPTISISPAAQIITEGDAYTAPTVTATDPEDGAFAANQITYTDPDGVFDGTLNTAAAGTFTGTASVTDSEGETVTATHTVTIQAASSGNFTLLTAINLGNADVIPGYNSLDKEPMSTEIEELFPLVDVNGAATNLVLRKAGDTTPGITGKVINESRNTFGVNAAGTETPAAANKSFWRWSAPAPGPIQVELISAAQSGVYLKPNTNYKVQVVSADTRGQGYTALVDVNGVQAVGQADFTTSDVITPIEVIAQTNAQGELVIRVTIQKNGVADGTDGHWINAIKLYEEQ